MELFWLEVAPSGEMVSPERTEQLAGADANDFPRPSPRLGNSSDGAIGRQNCTLFCRGSVDDSTRRDERGLERLRRFGYRRNSTRAERTAAACDLRQCQRRHGRNELQLVEQRQREHDCVFVFEQRRAELQQLLGANDAYDDHDHRAGVWAGTGYVVADRHRVRRGSHGVHGNVPHDGARCAHSHTQQWRQPHVVGCQLPRFGHGRKHVQRERRWIADHRRCVHGAGTAMWRHYANHDVHSGHEQLRREHDQLHERASGARVVIDVRAVRAIAIGDREQRRCGDVHEPDHGGRVPLPVLRHCLAGGREVRDWQRNARRQSDDDLRYVGGASLIPD